LNNTRTQKLLAIAHYKAGVRSVFFNLFAVVEPFAHVCTAHGTLCNIQVAILLSVITCETVVLLHYNWIELWLQILS